ncbi:MAG TPA: hypothetical protein VMW65_01825 [Chloroflexota bacterium]|nr:hypothetical protein [Chloroflexota bacterium]
MNVALSLGATVVSLVFASILYRQYMDRWRPYQLVWALALAIFALGTFCQFVAERNGWSALVYRVWYFSGAMLAAAYLGQGTVYLMAPRKFAHVSLAILGMFSSAGLALVAVLPVNLSRALVDGNVTGNGFPTTLLLLLIPLNTYGTVALVGGALWSVYRFWRKGTMGRRALGTFLIAMGGMTVALGGTADRLGVPGLLYLTELAGVTIIFVGYLQTVAQSRTVTTPAVSPPSDASQPTSAHLV